MALGSQSEPGNLANSSRWQPGTPPEALSTALFDGLVVVFEGLGPMRRLVDRGRTILCEIFGTDDPPGAESRLSAKAFRGLALRARTEVAGDRVVRQQWGAVLAAVGYASSETWRDRIRLRVVPSRRDIDHARLAPLAPHRDTWGSRIMAQVNWWLPLYPLQEAATMVVWPEALREAVANNSGCWNIDEFKRSGGRYPLAPVATSQPDTDGTPVLIEPGVLIGFSGAHLHAGIHDHSGRTRFGIDSRSVWEPDRRAGRGAPNVDGAPGPEMWQWFDRPPAAEQPA